MTREELTAKLADLQRRARRARGLVQSARGTIGADHVHTARKLAGDAVAELAQLDTAIGATVAELQAARPATLADARDLPAGTLVGAD